MSNSKPSRGSSLDIYYKKRHSTIIT